MAQHPTILEASSNAIIVALSETELGKVILPSQLRFVEVSTGKEVELSDDANPTVQHEAAALQYANAINGLMPKFFRLQLWQDDHGNTHDMLVMERLYPLPTHHFDLSTRKKMMKQFEDQLNELHEHLFVHGDLMRPTHYYNRNDQAWMFKNIVQTATGLRLIDAGFGKIGNKENLRMVIPISFHEREELKCFEAYYLSSF